MKQIILWAFLVVFVQVAKSQPAPPETSGASEAKQIDRSQDNLFNPTPSDKMRDFSPDRPSVTNGPYTVDSGHWLVEVGLLEYTRDRDNSEKVRLDSFGFGDTNIRLGVTNYAELDLAFTAYTYIRSKDKITGSKLRQSGFSDLTLRSKINLFGGDGGTFAFGLIPSLTFPSGTDGVGARGFAGGIGVPIQIALPADFQLTIESIIQTVHESGGGSHFEYPNSVCIGHALTRKLSTYVEFASDIDTAAHSSWIGTIDTALVYQPVDNWQLDAGVNIGVTKAANDLLTFVGAAWRY